MKFIAAGMNNGDSVLAFIEADSEEEAKQILFSSEPQWEDENGFFKQIETKEASDIEIRVYEEEE